MTTFANSIRSNFGKVEVVQAMLQAFPEMRHQPGPHGIPLLAHATAGGEEAAPVVTLLQK